MAKKRNLLWLIFFLTFTSVYIALPATIPININLKGYKIEKTFSAENLDLKIGPFFFKRPVDIKKGLDIQGGSHLVFTADMVNIPESDRAAALSAVQANIDKRVNFYGVSEAIVQTGRSGSDYRIIVELPGVKDVDEAVDLIGQTAQLEFWEENPDKKAASESGEFFLKTNLTGKDLTRSLVQFDSNTGSPAVGLEFNRDGTKKFAEISTRAVGRMVAIFLDGTPVSAPKVDEPILTGSAIIRGNFTIDEAKKLSIQLTAGALPVPITLIEQRNIGATLGKESVDKSLLAGGIGLLMVMLYMFAYYGKLGLLADIALVIYALISLALYKLIPITLTLPGIAGFLLSIGMAVDSNILIFERMKEERRSGKSLVTAMELGFGRAWDSIRDANVCTLITAFVLINPLNWQFLNSSGMVRGFALNLFIGVVVSLFTGILVTRNLIRIFYRG